MMLFDAHTSGNDLVHHFSGQVVGRTFLLTGPSEGGIGAETVISLARGNPVQLILLGRSAERSKSTISSIRAINASIEVKFIEVDLTSLASTRRAAQTILTDSNISKIDVVINNAGVMACPFQTTSDGLELQLAANHLGHFILTNTIMPKIIAAGPGSRIVFISSSAHRYNPFRFQDPNFALPGSYTEFGSYGSSKVAVILYAVALNQRLKQSGIRAYTLHPGSVRTNLQSHAKNLGNDGLEMLDEATWRIHGTSLRKHQELDGGKTLQQGCATTLRAALDPSLEDADGVYLEDTNLTTDTRLIKEWATDKELAERCWKLSEELVGQEFNLQY